MRSRCHRKKQKDRVPGMIPLADLLQLQEDMFARATADPDSMTVADFHRLAERMHDHEPYVLFPGEIQWIRTFEYKGQRMTIIGYEPKYWEVDA